MAWFKTTSVPGFSCKCKSAIAQVSVSLGSTTIIFVCGFWAFWASTLRQIMGWHQAGFAPVT